ncbi:MAG: efflux RND transporter periplasmic adaptor subunit [Polyangiaceae bacterium]
MTTSSISRLLVVSAALCVAAGCHRPGGSAEQKPSSDPSLFQVPENQRAGLNVVAVHTRPVTLPVDVPAVVNFNELKTSRVVPLVSGRVSSVQVHEGDSVQAGQVLMTIASPDSSDTVANLARDRSSLQAKKVILARDQDLYTHKAISLEELQQAELDVTASEATVRDDQAHVTITGGVGSQAVVRAPIAGIVVSRSIAAGESVQAGSTECFTITDPTAVWVVAQLYQEDLRQIAKNDVVIIRSPVLVAPLKGTVSYIGASLDTDTLTIPVRIAAGNPDGLLKKGMYVNAEIVPSKAIDTIVIPAAAIVRDEDNLPFVYVEASPGSFARRHVELGPQVDKDFAIESGLADGDKVLADGAVFAQFVQSLSR